MAAQARARVPPAGSAWALPRDSSPSLLVARRAAVSLRPMWPAPVDREITRSRRLLLVVWLIRRFLVLLLRGWLMSRMAVVRVAVVLRRSLPPRRLGDLVAY